MNHAPRCAWLVFALLMAPLFVAPRALAQASDPVVAAEALFVEGRALFKNGSFAAACPKFAESQRLDPAVGTLFNLADCEEHIGKIASSWLHWREVVEGLSSNPSDVRYPIAKTHVASLEPRLPRLTVKLAEGAPRGVTVTRDDLALSGAALGGALPVDPGEHSIEVRAPGTEERRYSVRVAEGAREEITVSAGAALPPPPSDAIAPKTEPDGGRRLLAIVVGGAGIAAIGAGSIFGITAANRYSEAKSRCPSPSNCDPGANDEVASARDAGNIATVAFIAGGALVAGGVVLWLTAPRVSVPRASLHVAPAAMGRGYGLAMGGAF